MLKNGKGMKWRQNGLPWGPEVGRQDHCCLWDGVAHGGVVSWEKPCWVRSPACRQGTVASERLLPSRLPGAEERWVGGAHGDHPSENSDCEWREKRWLCVGRGAEKGVPGAWRRGAGL